MAPPSSPRAPTPPPGPATGPRPLAHLPAFVLQLVVGELLCYVVVDVAECLPVVPCRQQGLHDQLRVGEGRLGAALVHRLCFPRLISRYFNRGFPFGPLIKCGLGLVISSILTLLLTLLLLCNAVDFTAYLWEEEEVQVGQCRGGGGGWEWGVSGEGEQPVA